MGDETPKGWTTLASDRAYQTRVFDVMRILKRSGTREGDFYVLSGADWTNIIPVDEQGNVIMIEQFRHGIERVTLEIPGGLIDPDDASPLEAARRELREETGYDGTRIVELGSIHPNPAIQQNRCHSFLALDVRRVAEPSPDECEDIIVRPIPLDRIPSLVASGEISHALVVVAFSFLALRHPDLFAWPLAWRT